MPVPSAKSQLEKFVRQFEPVDDSYRRRKWVMPPLKVDLFKRLIRKIARDSLDPLTLYKPMPMQLEAHKCDILELLLLGSNRGAKTLTAAIEFAWAVRGMHPYKPYPKENGRAIVVGKDGTQLGQVLYRKLFQAGAMHMIQDEETKLFRIYEPWRDEARIKQRKPCLPLIPQRMIKDIAWENRAEHVPTTVTLTNGWEIMFRSSIGNPPTGVDVDIVWFDEEIREMSRDTDWYAEMSARLIDRRGRFIWSATPQAATARLYELHERAADERDEEHPSIREFLMLIADNIYLPEQDKLAFIKKHAADPETYRVRVEGQFLITSFYVYQNFKLETHGVPWFRIPDDWCRYMVVDPGFAHTKATFFAVPPPDCKTHDPTRVYVYDELDINNCTAKEFALQLKHKIAGQNIEEFIIDRHGSRKTEMGTGSPIHVQMSEEMDREGCWSISTDSNFILVGDEGYSQPGELRAQIQQCRSWLWEREEGHPPKLAVLMNEGMKYGGVVPKFVEQMTKYRNKKDKPDEPDSKKYSEGPDTFRYMVLRNPGYINPKKPLKKRNPIVDALKKKRRLKKKDGGYILLG